MWVLFNCEKHPFYAIQFRQTVLIQTIQFSISIVFVYTQLNVETVLFQPILWSISTQFSSIWPIDRTLSGGSSGNEGVLHIPQCSSITRTSPSGLLYIYIYIYIRRNNSFPFVLAPLRRSLCLFWRETHSKGLRARSPARPEVEEGRKVPEKTARKFRWLRKAEKNSWLEIAVQGRTRSAEGDSKRRQSKMS